MTDAVSPRGETPDSPAGDNADHPGPDELRASDADRERVAEHLRDAMAEGRLDMEEFQERLEATYKARTYGELAPITRDLPTGAGVAKVSMTKAPVPDSADTTDWPARIGGEPTSSGGFAFWGGFTRKGNWTIARTFTAFAMWGGGEIDLRSARFEDRDITIRCFTIMGGIQVTAPPELNVQVSGIGIMGGFGDSTTGEEDPSSPRVKVTGFALMGGVGVERKVTRAEKLRLREERHQLREERRRERAERREARRAEIHGRRDARHRELESGHGFRHDLLGDDREASLEERRGGARRDRDGRDRHRWDERD